MPTPTDYGNLRDALASPRARTFSPAALAEFLHPHHAPEDPEFPTPIHRGDEAALEYRLGRLIGDLPLRQRAICVLLGIETALKLNWPFLIDRLDDDRQSTPLHDLLDRLWAHVWQPDLFSTPPTPAIRDESGEGSGDEIGEGLVAANELDVMLIEAREWAYETAVENIAWALDWAVRMLVDARPDHAIPSVMSACAACTRTQTPTADLTVIEAMEILTASANAFLRQWWTLCRCRLPIADIATAILE